MIEVVAVKIEGSKRGKYFLNNNLKLKKGLTVIVETERGLEFGKLETNIRQTENSEIEEPLNKVIRIASKQDYLIHQKNLREAKKALKVCKNLIKDLNLKMRIINSNFTFDRNQLQFCFLAQERIDFRELVKKLASIYKTRIELRQIGIRDKAREIGGIGQCGRRLCCENFLNNIDNVSISMAKEQNLSLNPSKINGSCGRLLCCLKFEEENYQKYRKLIPKIGSKVQTEKGEGIVVSTDPLMGKYKVDVADAGIIEINLEKKNS